MPRIFTEIMAKMTAFENAAGGPTAGQVNNGGGANGRKGTSTGKTGSGQAFVIEGQADVCELARGHHH